MMGVGVGCDADALIVPHFHWKCGFGRKTRLKTFIDYIFNNSRLHFEASPTVEMAMNLCDILADCLVGHLRSLTLRDIFISFYLSILIFVSDTARQRVGTVSLCSILN